MPELLRRRVLDLPAAPVLPDDPGGVRSTPRASTAAASSGSWSRSSLRLARARDRGRRAVHVPLLAGTTSSARCSTRARTSSTGRSRSGSSQFRSLYQVQWNLTMAATLLFMVPVILVFFARPEGVRRGRDADGGEGMKVAVVGGGSTYTPELVVRPRARARAARPGRARRCTTSTPARLEVVGGLARRMLDAQRLRRRLLELTADLDRALDGADAVLLQLRVGGQAARLRDETFPLRAAASARRRPAPAASPRRCAPSRSCSRSPSARASCAAPGAWIVDFTNPVGIVTRALLDAGHRAVGLCNVAIGFQRRFARAARRRAARGSSSTRSASTTSPGCARCGSTARDVLAELIASHGDALAADVELPRALLDELGAVPSYYLRYFYAHDAVLAEQRAGDAAGGDGRRDRARAARAVPRPRARRRSRRCSSSAAARSTARRRSALLASLVAGRRRGARGRRAQRGALAGLADDDVVEVPRGRRGGGALPQAPLAPECSARAARRGLRALAARARGRPGIRPTSRRALLAHPLDRPDGTRVDALPRALLAPAGSAA